MINELILVGVSFFHPIAERDSLGVETINGKIFVIHKVDEKETLYAISRRYGTTVEAITENNPGIAGGIELGQILKVPYTPKTSSATVATAGQVHKVAPKETLFSISKAYGISVDELKQWNNLADNSLTVGQELIVKKGKSSPVSVPSSATNSVKSGSATPANKLHTVAPKETLYSIARQYNISVQQLKDWNDFASTDLKIGQEIYVGEPSEKGETKTPTVVDVRKEPTVTESTKQNKTTTASSTPSSAASTPTTSQPSSTGTSASTPSKTQTIRISEAVKNTDEIMEAGLAELIEGTEGNRKYLALHRTAPKGTILKVRNEMNNREVFVRVLDKLPGNSPNDKVIIKLSKSAYDRLGAIDPKFRVEVTYYK